MEEKARKKKEGGIEGLRKEIEGLKGSLEGKEGELKKEVEVKIEELARKEEELSKEYEKEIVGVKVKLEERGKFLKDNPFGKVVEKLKRIERGEVSFEGVVGLIKDLEGDKEVRGEIIGIVKGYIKGEVKGKVKELMEKGKVPEVVIGMVEGMLDMDIEGLRGEGLRGIVSRVVKENIGVLKERIESSLGIKMPSEEKWKEWAKAMEEKLMLL